MTFQLSGAAPELYERIMVPLWFQRWGEALVELLDIAPGDRVLDVACGTGVTTRLVHDRLGPKGQVDGLDINAPMLTKARDLAGGRAIRWIEADVTASGLPGNCFDVILSQHGYHYFPDKPAALREFHRLLAPGGRMGFSIWDGHSAYTRALCAAVERYISPEVAAQQRAQRETPDAATLAAQAREAGFRQVAVIRQELTIDVPHPEEFVPLHVGSMPIAQAFADLDAPSRTRLIADVASALADHIQGDRLLYPDAVHVVTARV